MADTSVNHEAERWVVEVGLPAHLPGMKFAQRKMKLTWGGAFAFDAVSDDGSVVAAVSTSAAHTATGKLATAKYQKLKTDALYLLHLETSARKVMVFTEPCMKKYFENAAAAGRFPPSIELVHIPLPHDLQARVITTRLRASAETSPINTSNAAKQLAQPNTLKQAL
jgi:hypothetical protein